MSRAVSVCAPAPRTASYRKRAASSLAFRDGDRRRLTQGCPVLGAKCALSVQDHKAAREAFFTVAKFSSGSGNPVTKIR